MQSKKKITKSEAAAGNLRMACAQVLIDHELLVAFARPKQFFLVSKSYILRIKARVIKALTLIRILRAFISKK